MRTRILLQLGCMLTLFVCLTWPSAAADEPPRIVAIIVGATLDVGTPVNPGIGRGVVRNVERLEEMLGELKKTAKIPVEIVKVVDKNFGCKQMNKALGKHKLKSNDTVVFYYAGHGLRADAPVAAGSSSDKFPILWCTKPLGPNAQDLHFSAIVNRLHAMGPRLVIGIADACNRESLEGPSARGIGFSFNPVRLRQLWLGYKGVLMFSAAQPGEDAYYAAPSDPEAPAYGFFSQQLFDAIEQELVDADSPKWESIAAAALSPIPVPQVGMVQHPQFDDFKNDPERQLQSTGLIP